MTDSRDEWINKRAYQLWHDAGRPDGQDHEHWYQASGEWETQPNAGGTGDDNPEKDAEGQFAPSQADRNADGVVSAKPTVVTGSEDATVNRDPPGKASSKDFDLNYDPTETTPPGTSG